MSAIDDKWIDALLVIAEVAQKYRDDVIGADECDCPDDDLCLLCRLGFALEALNTLKELSA